MEEKDYLEDEEEQNFIERIKSLNLRKVIKVATIVVGAGLIIFISFFSISFDFANFKWGDWLANSSILVGIMIFGILMGTSIGTDNQKEKKDGDFQKAVDEYDVIRLAIDTIKIYFSQFWLWYKQKKLIEKKINYLVDREFKVVDAKKIIANIDNSDLVVGKLLFDENKAKETVYSKNDVLLWKLDKEHIEIVKKALELKLNTMEDAYYLTAYDDGQTQTNEAELGKAIQKKIDRDKRTGFAFKIVSSLVISIIWSAFTIKDFVSGGGDEAVQKAWLNLFSRISALITSFVSGYSTSVINVRDQTRAIKNKTSILKEFEQSYNEKLFFVETDDERINKAYQEQLALEQEKE